MIRASCKCTASVMLRDGVAVCALCFAPVLGSEAGASERVYTTLQLPPDVKSADAFNRACRTSLVAGASKRGRVWTCTVEAWRARARAGAPRLTDAQRAAARAKRLHEAKPAQARAAASAGDDLLAELGAVRKRTGS
jgi:hypothetical protein